MINILPPDVKTQLNYSKRNSRLLKYLVWAGLVVLGLGLLTGGSLWYANRQARKYEQILVTRQSERTEYQETQSKVQTLQGSLGVIEKLLNEKTHYSTLLNDLASTLPAGAYITHMTLTGDDKKPLELAINVDSFNKAAEARNALIASARIKNADIQNIAKNEDGEGFNVAIIAAFESGQAR